MTDPDWQAIPVSAYEDSAYELRIVKVPMLDTGIGQEAGYASDREFVEAVEVERALLPEIVRQQLEKFDRRETKAFLFGGLGDGADAVTAASDEKQRSSGYEQIGDINWPPDASRKERNS